MATPQEDRTELPRLSAELAYQTLPADNARVFRLLPVHPGPDTCSATVAALADMRPTEARSVLLSLKRAGLVRAVPGGGDRWRLHYRARAYARRLSRAHATADRREAARDRLLCHYQIATEAADGWLQGRPPIPVPQEFGDREGALAWLDTERTNLLAVIRMAADASRDHAAKSLPLLMAYYLNFRGFFDDLLEAMAISLNAARRLGDYAAEGQALNNFGGALSGLGRYAEALTSYQDAVKVFRQTGDLRAEAESSANLAISLTGLGRYDEALIAYRDTLAVLRLSSSPRATGAALNNLGIALRSLRRYDEARAAYQEAAGIFREAGDRHGLAMTLGNLGNVLQSQGRPADAIGIYQEAAGIFRETGDRPREAATRENLLTAQRAR